MYMSCTYELHAHDRVINTRVSCTWHMTVAYTETDKVHIAPSVCIRRLLPVGEGSINDFLHV
jgi:hypothetical protein